MPTISRRSFVALSTLASTSALFANHSWGNGDVTSMPLSREPVRLNFNESPYGPSPKALEAMRRGATLTGRYHYDEQVRLVELFASQNDLPVEYVHAYCGSRAPLQHAISAFTGQGSLVAATPSYDSAIEAARAQGTTVHEVSLTASGAHDIPAMLRADSQAGLIYLCNPNNPTGTLTPHKDIELGIANKPKQSVLLIDEAYIHFSDAPDCLRLAAERDDVLILRTFSKLYGMAGARLGFAIGHPNLLQRMEKFGGNNFVPLPASMAGIASLEDPDLARIRKEETTRNRNETLAALRNAGFTCTDSHANCFMIDTGRPAQETIDALERRNVLIGRAWAAWPEWVRVSVGSAEDMQKFLQAFFEIARNPIA